MKSWVVPGKTFEIGEAARAIGVPVRRLEGWVERGILRPSTPAKGPGSRRAFRWGDLVKGAILVELQGLFGNTFRPGAIPHHLMRDWAAGGIEEIFGNSNDENESPEQGFILAFTRHGKGQELHVVKAKGLAELADSKPAVFAVNFAVIQERLRKALLD